MDLDNPKNKHDGNHRGRRTGTSKSSTLVIYRVRGPVPPEIQVKGVCLFSLVMSKKRYWPRTGERVCLEVEEGS